MSLDYMLFGDASKDNEIVHTDEVNAILCLLDQCSDRNRTYALRMLKLFLIACNNESDNNEKGIS